MNISDFFDQCVQTIRAGGIVLGPCDTCYGIFCDATNKEAVNKTFSLKKRDIGKPVSMIVSNKEMAQRFVEWDAQVETMWNQFAYGTYTMILPKKPEIKLPVSMRNTLGIRVPDYDFWIKVSEACDVPIVSTSANASGQPVHYNIPSIGNEIDLSQIDLIIDIGEIPHIPPSTLVVWSAEKFDILKRG